MDAGFKGIPDWGKFQGALSQIDTVICHEVLGDVSE